jgi:formylglycine-generating enzyme required for sulfatase activity
MTDIGSGENEREAGRGAAWGVMPMTAESHVVRCGQCHRERVVAVSDLRPPCFRNVEEQADCPEILQRRAASADETLLTMMCGALAASFAESLERAAVNVVDRGGTWQVACSIPGDGERYYSPDQARSQSETWSRCGGASLARRFLVAAKKADQASRNRRRMRRLVPILGFGMVVAAVVGAAWLLPARSARQPTEVAMQAPEPEQQSAAAAGIAATPVSAHQPLTVEPPDPQPAGQEATAPPSSQAAPPATAIEQAPSVLRAASVEQAPSTPQTSSMVQAPSNPSAKALASAASAALDATSMFHAAPLPEPPAVPEMVSLPGDTFAMGSNLDPSEEPVHRVSIKPFAISKGLVTVHAWSQCVAAKACPDVASDENEDAPITNVSFADAQRFIAWLSQATRVNFRLPSEAEWEYAARGGTRTKYWWGDDVRPGMVNCKGCNGDQPARPTVRAENFKPNPFGLYDMGGNVAQWVSDCWHKNYQGAVADGSAWVDHDYCVFHVVRSGSWRSAPNDVRPASRDYYDGRIRYPTHGFRVARSL